MPAPKKKLAKSITRLPTRALAKPARRAVARRKSPLAKKTSAGEWFDKLVAVQKRLRAPKGCPWDREQTHATLRPYLIEEAYEVLDALDSGDDAKFADEMGDLLLQVVFHSDIARQQGRFTVADVVRAIHDKMVRRHPHVFGNARAKNSAQVLRNWERIKAQERLAAQQVAKPTGPQIGAASSSTSSSEKPASLLDGVSSGLPAMLQGLQLTRKAARAGFDWHNAGGIFEKLREEMAEVRHALTEKNSARAEEELGDLLFAAVNLARFVDVDPEIALKKANSKFQRRFMQMERAAVEHAGSFADLPREEMESLWDAVKFKENNHSGNQKPNAASPAAAKSANQKLAAAHSR
ncbi:MAG: nucleoside triphosphate pyrophosphohydrolase [Acidobacteriota bacterium]|nr:nucleoside triphosphate pyrophosphohydrolase [Acidobacteriota bacterium]